MNKQTNLLSHCYSFSIIKYFNLFLTLSPCVLTLTFQLSSKCASRKFAKRSVLKMIIYILNKNRQSRGYNSLKNNPQ